MVRVMLRQIMNKSLVITNRLSLAIAGLLMDYLFSSDQPVLKLNIGTCTQSTTSWPMLHCDITFM